MQPLQQRLPPPQVHRSQQHLPHQIAPVIALPVGLLQQLVAAQSPSHTHITKQQTSLSLLSGAQLPTPSPMHSMVAMVLHQRRTLKTLVTHLLLPPLQAEPVTPLPAGLMDQQLIQQLLPTPLDLPMLFSPLSGVRSTTPSPMHSMVAMVLHQRRTLKTLVTHLLLPPLQAEPVTPLPAGLMDQQLIQQLLPTPLDLPMLFSLPSGVLMN